MALGDKLPVVMGKEKAVANGVATLGADGKLAEAQRPTTDAIPTEDSTNPVQSGGVFNAIAALTGEDIPTSGTDETTIATALSNKAEWDGGFLNSGSILTWAENQAINTHVATNSGVTGFLYATAWAVDFYLYPAGGWRRLIATDIQLGVSYYCIKNASQPWSTWTPIATATQPQEYNLPVSSNVSPTTVVGGTKNSYHKNQFGEVTISLGVDGTITNGMTLFTLPEGYRPSGNVAIACYATDGGVVAIPAFIIVNSDGYGRIFNASGVNMGLVFASGSFLAS